MAKTSVLNDQVVRRFSRRDAVFLAALVYCVVAVTQPFGSTFNIAFIDDDADVIVSLSDDADIPASQNRHLMEATEKGTEADERPTKVWDVSSQLRPKKKDDLREIQVRSLLSNLTSSQRLNRFDRSPRKLSNEDLSCVYTAIENQTQSECYELLSPFLKSKRAWFFVGDSQMGKLFHEIRYPYEVTASKAPKNERCGFIKYAGLPEAKPWQRKKIPSYFQGPTSYGRENPGCFDVRSVGARYIESAIPGEMSHILEIMTIDHASDIAQQTPYTETTQETATLHFGNQLQFNGMTYEDSVCVMNTGLHDQKLCIGKTHDHCLSIYSKNIKRYLNLFHNICGAMVWISTTPVRNPGNPLYPQSNAMTAKMNRAVKDILIQHEHGYYVDTWDVAKRSTHIDNVHFTSEYYSGIADLLASLM